jgi:hypothetical protein
MKYLPKMLILLAILLGSCGGGTTFCKEYCQRKMHWATAISGGRINTFVTSDGKHCWCGVKIEIDLSETKPEKEAK